MTDFEKFLKAGDVENVMKFILNLKVISDLTSFIQKNSAASILKSIAKTKGIKRSDAIRFIDESYDNFRDYLRDWLFVVEILANFNNTSKGTLYSDWFAGAKRPEPKLYYPIYTYSVNSAEVSSINKIMAILKSLQFKITYRSAKIGTSNVIYFFKEIPKRR